MARRSFWNDQMIDLDIANGVESLISLLSGLGTDIATELTLIRTIIRLDVMSTDPVETNQGIQRLAMGIGVVSNEAFAIGTTAVPDSNTSGEHPARGWVYRTAGAIQINISSGAVLSEMWRVDEDIRTKRKIDRGDLFMKFANLNVQGTGNSLTVVGVVRCLLLLP